jgi:hypothetical protein
MAGKKPPKWPLMGFKTMIICCQSAATDILVTQLNPVAYNNVKK